MSKTPTLKRLLRHIKYQSRRSTLPLRQAGFSSFSEEETLKTYVAELLPATHSRTIVDIGAGDGRTGSNTLALLKSGWKGIGIEADPRKAYKLAKIYQHLPAAYECCLSVTPENVLPLLETYGIEKNFGVLNLDIDSYDYWVLDKILGVYRPCIVITEINEKIPPPIKFRVKYTPDFRFREHFYGFSIACLDELCAQHGYVLLNLEYNNAFLAPAELAASRAITSVDAYRQGYLEREDRREKFHRNDNMEVLHSLPPAEGLRFIENFFSSVAGQYELGIGDSRIEQMGRINRLAARR